MLRATLVRTAALARQPSIRFPDRKKLQQQAQGETIVDGQPARTRNSHSTASLRTESHEPHPHPAAPKAVAEDFAHFQEVFKSGPHFHPEKIGGGGEASASGSSGGSGGATAPGVVDDVQQLPSRFWKTPTLLLEEDEMDAIMVSTSESGLDGRKVDVDLPPPPQSGGATLLRR